MRKIDRGLLDHIATLPCICCEPGRQTLPTDPHHITTVKNHGDDSAENVMPLCRKHHTQWHKEGPGKLMRKYPAVKTWLELAGRDDVLARTERVK